MHAEGPSATGINIDRNQTRLPKVTFRTFRFQSSKRLSSDMTPPLTHRSVGVSRRHIPLILLISSENKRQNLYVLGTAAAPSQSRIA